MHKYDIVTNKNFEIYCIKAYDNAHCVGIEEFYEDIRRIKYIKKLLTRYEQTGELKERLILNHIITLNNVFGPDVLVKIMFLKMRKFMKYLKPFLIMLNVMPDVVYNVEQDGNVIYTDDITMDQKIVDTLRNL